MRKRMRRMILEWLAIFSLTAGAAALIVYGILGAFTVVDAVAWGWR